MDLRQCACWFDCPFIFHADSATGLASSRYDDSAIVVYIFLCISFRRQLAQ